MKNNVKYFIIALLCVSGFQQAYPQFTDKEQRFFTIMKVYNLSQGTPTFQYEGEIRSLGANLFEYYLNVFDSYNYQKVRNDEFEKNKYFQSMSSKMIKSINNVKFDKKYVASINATIGEYSFSNNSFPIFVEQNNRLTFYNDANNYLISECVVLNDDAFNNMYLKMSETKAKIFINGGNNRRVYLNYHYSVVNKTTKTRSNYANNLIGRNVVIYLYKIDICSDRSMSNILETLYPTYDYYDKVNGVKIKDGTGTSYYRDGWQSCSKEEAKFYRIINYADGKISGTVKDYYISGKLQMEGTYNDYWAENGYENGLFVGYYENGQKSFEVIFKQGVQNGKYTSWYENGKEKEEVNMINGKKDGVDYQWTETGDPMCQYGGNFPYFDFYKNGEIDLYNRQYPTEKGKQ